MSGLEVCLLTRDGGSLRVGDFVVKGSSEEDMRKVVGAPAVAALEDAPLLYLARDTLCSVLCSDNGGVCVNVLPRPRLEAVLQSALEVSNLEHYLKLCCVMYPGISVRDTRRSIGTTTTGSTTCSSSSGSGGDNNGGHGNLAPSESSVESYVRRIRGKLLELRSRGDATDEEYQALVGIWHEAVDSIGDVSICDEVERIECTLNCLAEQDSSSMLSDSRLMLGVRACLERCATGCSGKNEDKGERGGMPQMYSIKECAVQVHADVLSVPKLLFAILALAEIFQNKALADVCSSVLRVAADEYLMAASQDDWEHSDKAKMAAGVFCHIGAGAGLSDGELAHTVFACRNLFRMSKPKHTADSVNTTAEDKFGNVLSNTLLASFSSSDVKPRHHEEDLWSGDDFCTDSDGSETFSLVDGGFCDDHNHDHDDVDHVKDAWIENGDMYGVHRQLPSSSSASSSRVQLTLPVIETPLPERSVTFSTPATDGTDDSSSSEMGDIHKEYGTNALVAKEDVDEEEDVDLEPRTAGTFMPCPPVQLFPPSARPNEPITRPSDSTEEGPDAARRRALVRCRALRSKNEMDKTLASAQYVLRKDRLKTVDLRASVIRVGSAKSTRPSENLYTTSGRRVEGYDTKNSGYDRKVHVCEADVEPARRRAALRVKQKGAEMRRKAELAKSIKHFEQQKKWVKRNDNIARYMQRSPPLPLPKGRKGDDKASIQGADHSDSTLAVPGTLPHRDALAAVGLEPDEFLEISRAAVSSHFSQPSTPLEVGPSLGAGDGDSSDMMRWLPAVDASDIAGDGLSSDADDTCDDEAWTMALLQGGERGLMNPIRAEGDEVEEASVVSSLDGPSGVVDDTVLVEAVKSSAPILVVRIGRAWGLQETIGGEGTYAVVSVGKIGTLSTNVSDDVGESPAFNVALSFEVPPSAKHGGLHEIDDGEKVTVLLYGRHSSMSDEPVACCTVDVGRVITPDGAPVVFALSRVGLDGLPTDNFEAEAGFIQMSASLEMQ